MSNATINGELAPRKRSLRWRGKAGKPLGAPHIPMLREDNVRKGFFKREVFEALRAELHPRCSRW